MNNILEFIGNNILFFDVIFILITIYTMIHCALKGFTLSLLSFSKWLIALVITITLVPRLGPWVEDYIESKFVSDIGLGICIFIISLFLIIVLNKGISNVVTWSGLGVVDKTFGLIFGVFKGYMICVCLFSLLNWFYPYQKWPISTDNTYTFDIVYKGSKFLIKKFPNEEDYLEDAKKKIKEI